LEASALQHTSRLPVLPGRSPLLRLQSDERLITLTRRGHTGAFETLVLRYQSRLLAFCRHMLGSAEDAEDVLQEVFAASFNAILSDDRPINARPWLYRIARNRCLNHLRRPIASGQDSMDVFERDGGTTTADTVHKREEFRQIVADVHGLPESQRTALLLREIDALSYDQIAEAMETTVPSVKSLLVRARVSLAEAAEARLLSCGEVRMELGQVAEGLARTSAPVRRHLRGCDRCRIFRTELRRANRALAAVYPIGPLVFLKLALAKLGGGAAAGGSGATGSSGAAGGAGLAGSAAASGGAATAGGTTAGGFLSAGVTSIATKAAAGFAAAAIVTAGAAEVKQVTTDGGPARPHRPTVAAGATVVPKLGVRPQLLADRAQLVAAAQQAQKADKQLTAAVTPTTPAAPTTTTTAATATPASSSPSSSAGASRPSGSGSTQEGSATVAPGSTPQESSTSGTKSADGPDQTASPGQPSSGPPPSQEQQQQHAPPPGSGP
jgi:RNA polymerase sigma factor (sigma-70 family)